MAKRNVFLQMFDIRPTDVFGNVDHERIKNLQRIITVERKRTAEELTQLRNALHLKSGGKPGSHAVPPVNAKKTDAAPSIKKVLQPAPPQDHRTHMPGSARRLPGLEGHSFLPSREELMREIEIIEERDLKLALLGHLTQELERDLEKRPVASSQALAHVYNKRASRAHSTLEKLTELSRRSAYVFSPSGLSQKTLRTVAGMFLGALFLGSLAFFVQTRITQTAASARSQGLAAYDRLMRGVDATMKKDFTGARGDFSIAHNSLKSLGGVSRLAASSLTAIADTLSFSNETTSGIHVLDAAQGFAKAGEDLAAYAALFTKNGVGSLTPKEFITGYLGSSDLQRAKELLSDAVGNLEKAQEDLERADIEKLPPEFQKSIAMLRDRIPETLALAKQFASFQDSLFDVFGYLGPRKYLVVFQNSAEERPTGGFIGSYALLDVLDGKITHLLIDDVFNIDGQLVDKVVPPMPIQKISTAWSLHDANWFFDYPVSAKKMSWFFERTGGASVDGVFALTPSFLQDILSLTGPVLLPGYDLELTQENFQDELSYLIEEGTLKKEGESPKVVLRDLGTLLFDGLQAQWSSGEVLKFLDIVSSALEKRDLMLWVKEPSIAEFLARQRWDGGIRVSDGDYLAVVDTNINGYKTDRVIAQEISHDAHILQDGSVVDTLTVTRLHHGSPARRYDALYQKVNADYLRVYVPKGSELLGAEGHTIQEYVPPINYLEASFKTDPEVGEVESSLRIDERSGTQIYDEAGKTVFANWVYVSPGESVTLRYTYRLPWKVRRDGTGTYVMLAQRQAGAERTMFSGSLRVDGADVITEGDIPQGIPFEKDIEYSSKISKNP